MPQFKNHNPPTVVVAVLQLIEHNCQWVLIERGKKDDPGFGKLAFPGGFQEMGETWQQTAMREVREETGIELTINPFWSKIHSFETVEDGSLNLLFTVLPVKRDQITDFSCDEVRRVIITDEAVQLAFPAHNEIYHELRHRELIDREIRPRMR